MKMQALNLKLKLVDFPNCRFSLDYNIEKQSKKDRDHISKSIINMVTANSNRFSLPFLKIDQKRKFVNFQK